MHPRVYREYERICSERQIIGSVLEIGAVPSEESLLCMNSLKNASAKIGINLDGPHTFKDISILKGNSNSMEMMRSDNFDAVLCNATLEHDPFFWKTVAEIKRVTRPGGLIVIGAPGYKRYSAEKLKSALLHVPLIRRLVNHEHLNCLFTATITFEVHEAPGDYYRFSEQAFKGVIFEGMKDVHTRSIMSPPRIIGYGIKP
jgi:SAM-dependent methyltransferase